MVMTPSLRSRLLADRALFSTSTTFRAAVARLPGLTSSFAFSYDVQHLGLTADQLSHGSPWCNSRGIRRARHHAGRRCASVKYRPGLGAVYGMLPGIKIEDDPRAGTMDLLFLGPALADPETRLVWLDGPPPPWIAEVQVA